MMKMTAGEEKMGGIAKEMEKEEKAVGEAIKVIVERSVHTCIDMLNRRGILVMIIEITHLQKHARPRGSR